MFRLLVPSRANADQTGQYVHDLFSAARPGTPYSPERLAFAAALSRRIFELPGIRTDAQLSALAFWLRPASMRLLQQRHQQLNSGEVVWLARGKVLHFAPANVDTIFVYSWMLSLLAGNCNVVRISQRRPELLAPLLQAIDDVLQDSGLADSNFFVTFPHGHPGVDALCAAADLRVIWGGDASIASIRKHPLAPHATELVFPDRYSLAAINAEAWAAAAEENKVRLLSAFYNDAYGFDQAACSSPRTVFWLGSEAQCAAASDEFFRRLTPLVQEKGFDATAALGLMKMAYSHGAAADSDRVTAIHHYSNGLTTLRLSQAEAGDAQHCGGGLFYECFLGRLEDLGEILCSRHQTLGVWGFSRPALMQLAQSTDRNGLSRIVPVGEALNFSAYWDGYDLVAAMMRTVHIPQGAHD